LQPDRAGRRVLSARLAPPGLDDAGGHGVDDGVLPCRRRRTGGHRRGLLLGQARAQSFFNGFFDQSAELWNEAGDLLATTHQIVYFKE
jgi:hypothetical protein